MAGRKVKNDNTRPPQNPEKGRLWFDQMLGRTRVWNGKEWVDHVPGALAKKPLYNPEDMPPIYGLRGRKDDNE